MKVCIFCGARSGNSQATIALVEELCDLLIANNCELIYGGGRTGLMGAIADRFIDNGKDVIGVRPRKLIKEEAFHTGLSELYIVDTMHERKARMVELADCFIALPGGVGTLDEIVETFTLFKLGITTKPSGILNAENYYAGLEIMLAQMEKSDFLKEEDRVKLIIEDNPTTLLQRLKILRS